MRKFAYLAAYLVPLLAVVGYALGGWFNLLTPLFIFGMIPLLDLLVGPVPTNLDEQGYKQRKDERWFRWVTWAFVPLNFALVIWAAYAFAQQAMQPYEAILFVISIGLVSGGVGITIAHELGHRAEKFEQFLAKALLLCSAYQHFFIEHNYGHHANVATKHDPASARFGESLYAFLPRTIWGSYSHAWHIETRRLSRKKQGFWSVHNQMLWFHALPLAFGASLGFAFGWLAAAFYASQAVVAFLLLEMVNYIEHYGLERNRTTPGKFEKVQPIHSWNASEVVTNSLLFELQRHSDHHANPTRRYQTLRHFEESPQLPTGYAGMILLALVPPIWHRVMNPKVMQWREQHLRSV